MILHVDMDAFFASVEQLDDPALKGKCVLVGGASNRGVVAAASYEARKFGVHSAMPMFQAKKKCPQAIIVPPRKKRYSELSHKVMNILRDISPLVEPVSIDEAFVDIAGCERLYGAPEQIAKKIKSEIYDALSLTCSVGVAPLKFLAKIASDMDKPDGLTLIEAEDVPEFIASLPVSKVPGVGKRAKASLNELGVHSLGDVPKFSEAYLLRKFGKFGRRLFQLARGIDGSRVQPHTPTKSISSEETLPANTKDVKLLSKILMEQARDVARQLRRKGFRAKVVTIKIKHADFKQITRNVTVTPSIRSADAIYRHALALLEKYNVKTEVRLIGVGVSGLSASSVPVQRTLFETQTKKKEQHWEKVDETLDAIEEKFGKALIRRASQSMEDPN